MQLIFDGSSLNTTWPGQENFNGPLMSNKSSNQH